MTARRKTPPNTQGAGWRPAAPEKGRGPASRPGEGVRGAAAARGAPHHVGAAKVQCQQVLLLLVCLFAPLLGASTAEYNGVWDTSTSARLPFPVPRPTF